MQNKLDKLLTKTQSSPDFNAFQIGSGLLLIGLWNIIFIYIYIQLTP